MLGSDSGAIPEVIGRTDAIFPEGNAAALAALLETVLSSSAHRGELRDHGLARVQALYSKQRVAERTVEFWRHVANTPHSRA